MERVEITRFIVGICHMQVCSVADATDEEILAACNRGNLCGTERGWCTVERDAVPCADNDGRVHLLVAC